MYTSSQHIFSQCNSKDECSAKKDDASDNLSMEYVIR